MAVNPLHTATEGLLGGGSPLTIAARGLLSNLAGDNAIVPVVNIALTPWVLQADVPLLPNDVDLTASSIPITSNIPLGMTGELVTLGVVEIPVTTHPGTWELPPSISEIPSLNVPIDTQTPLGLEGEMSVIAVPNIPISVSIPFAYTAPSGFQPWKETIRYTLYLQRKTCYTLKR